MESYGEYLFTPNVRAEQDRVGMGERFDKMYRNRHRGPLDDDARAFIESRDSMYMATVSETGWPYVQHRGGPVGFLKVLAPERIGFADYAGNKQFISKGNLNGTDRVALFLMDYPRKARLKLLGHAQVVEATEDLGLAQALGDVEGPEPERLVTIDLVAMDWNCPKYITPRLTEAEIEATLGPRIRQMAARIEDLEARLDTAVPDWRNS